ncbi:hypothetical protein [Rhizobium leguminosarum]|nr:hypothetical protein [Rhizobium leguminosarum]WFT90923.1 hypothetical protein QA638_36345 [Rhizobium leguminosarum]
MSAKICDRPLRRQTMTELANFIRPNEDGTYLDGVVRWRLC